MGFCDTALKFIVFLVNLVFFLCGAVIIGFGAYLQVEMSTYLDFLDSAYLNSSVVLIIVGVIIMIIAFFGCCGAWAGNACMMYTFATLMGIVLLLELGVGIVILVYKNDVHDIVRSGMEDGMDNYGKGQYQGVTDTWNLIQHDFQCCGVVNYDDWAKSKWGQENPNNVPDSCCIEDADGCGLNQIVKPDRIFQEGCFDKFETFIMDKVALVGGVGAGIAVFQLIGIIIGCCLGKKMRDKDMYV